MNSLELLELTLEQKTKGVWLSGIEGEGEYKKWRKDNKLAVHRFFLKRKSRRRI
jgi:hypothetical protein